MSTLGYAVRDSRTMLRRDLRHMIRYPSLTMFVIGTPVVFLLLFVYVFGGTLGAGLGAAGGAGDDPSRYANYITPGILILTIAGLATGTAISIAMDMTEGIVARFRTMPIYRPSVLIGHVLGSMIQAALALAVVLGVAVLTGFRPSLTVGRALGAAGLLALVTLAVTWLSVGLGLVAKSVETASNSPSILLLLPFLGSGFVPTDSMPTALRWFAEYQPFTPIMETLRGLLLGTPIVDSAAIAAAWRAGLAALSYLWAKKTFNKA